MKASPNQWLIKKGTKGSKTPYFATTIYLGSSDSPENYEEVSDEEKNIIEAQLAESANVEDVKAEELTDTE